MNRSTFTDWDDFLPYNYDEDLLEEINHRSHGHGKSLRYTFVAWKVYLTGRQLNRMRKQS